MSSVEEVEVQFADESLRCDAPSPEFISEWAVRALQGELGFCTVRLVGREEITALNMQFRQKDSATNVLAFESGIPPEFAEGYLGDVVICVPVVQDEALLQSKSPNAHFAHMVVHGVLHLRGYDHVEQKDAKIMEQLEVQLLALEGMSNPYKTRSGDSTSSHG